MCSILLPFKLDLLAEPAELFRSSAFVFIRESINSATRRETVNEDSHKVIKTVDDNGNKLGRNFSSASSSPLCSAVEEFSYLCIHSDCFRSVWI